MWLVNSGIRGRVAILRECAGAGDWRLRIRTEADQAGPARRPGSLFARACVCVCVCLSNCLCHVRLKMRALRKMGSTEVRFEVALWVGCIHVTRRGSGYMSQNCIHFRLQPTTSTLNILPQSM